jgi:hypothetical protein
MKPGSRGLFGAGMYLAETVDAAKYKSQFDGAADPSSMVLAIEADLGIALVLEKGDASMTLSKLQNQYHCESVKGRSGPNTDWEFVVYDPSALTALGEEGEVAQRRSDMLDLLASGWGRPFMHLGAWPFVGFGVGPFMGIGAGPRLMVASYSNEYGTSVSTYWGQSISFQCHPALLERKQTQKTFVRKTFLLVSPKKHHKKACRVTGT